MKAIPNILSAFRICLVPVFIITFFTDPSDYRIIPVVIFAVAGLSDILDGIIARRFEAQTKLGKLLDPLADKLMTFSAIVCLTITRPVLFWAVCVFFVKEALMGIGGLILHKKGYTELPASNIIGKTSTVTFFIICILLMLLHHVSNTAAVLMIAIAVCFALAALVSYIVEYFKLVNTDKNYKLQNKEKQSTNNTIV